MARILRKFYVFAFFIIGIFFWAFLKNGLSSSSSSSASDPAVRQESLQSFKNSQKDLIDKQLSGLEKEIAAQKLYSNMLLRKMREKYRNKSKSEDIENQAKVEVENNSKLGNLGSNNNNNYKKDGRSREEIDRKRQAIERELQEDAHQGEVKSDIFDPNAIVAVDPGDNGEVVDDDHVFQRDGNVKNEKNKIKQSVIGVLVFVCDRPTIKRSLDQLLKYRPSDKQFPIIVSQDCGSHPATTSVIKSYGNLLTHIMQPDLSEIHVPPKENKMKGYYKIARHYGWALNYTFNTLKYDNVIIVEDDLDIAPDFFEYFSATLPLMKKDPTIWCVSAWNDNGKPDLINETAYDMLHRTDFFPGLGWMMNKDLWTELMVKWPRGYWDDWLREPAQRRDRVCIRPEISRSKTFGKEGVSHGTYYMNHLRFIKLNDHFVPFTSLNLTYLLKDNFDVEFVRRVYSSQLVKSVPELMGLTADSPDYTRPVEYRLVYRNQIEFRNYAKKLGLMDDFKAGVPRTAYRGVVSFVLKGFRCYLAPGANWVSYN